MWLGEQAAVAHPSAPVNRPAFAVEEAKLDLASLGLFAQTLLRQVEKPVRGEVTAVGKGKVLDNGEVRALEVKVGDQVLFGKYSGTEVKVGGEDLLVMREEDVMAVIED